VREVPSPRTRRARNRAGAVYRRADGTASAGASRALGSRACAAATALGLRGGRVIRIMPRGKCRGLGLAARATVPERFTVARTGTASAGASSAVGSWACAAATALRLRGGRVMRITP